MSKPIKTRIFNFFRTLFKIRLLENMLVKNVEGKTMGSFVYKFVPHSETYGHKETRYITRNGVKLRVYVRDFLGHGLYFGYRSQESESCERLFALIKPNFVCLDIGANIGYVSMSMAKLATEGRVIGFEPDPVNFKRASDNLNLNKLSNVTINQVAAGDRSAVGIIDVRAPQNRGGNRIANDFNVKGDSVEITTIDSYLPSYELGRLDLVKIDVEGFELKALKGAEQTLRRFLPMLFIEVDEENLDYQGDSPLKLIQFLKSIGYRSLLHSETLQPIDEKTSFKGMHFDVIAKA